MVVVLYPKPCNNRPVHGEWFYLAKTLSPSLLNQYLHIILQVGTHIVDLTLGYLTINLCQVCVDVFEQG